MERGTTLKHLSQSNRYWLEENRYKELKYFCLQYPEWKKQYMSLTGLSQAPENPTQKTGHGNPTARCAIAMDELDTKMAKVEQAAKETDTILANYILRGVTEGLSYGQLEPPCSRDTYYRYCRKFFWTLDQIKS
ncbi:MAG: hypothetical protein LUI14_14480 [Lachnospiraceae bacterium]|nr:hypothetical protein [Clostridiales bacterium]MCD7764358.1 hypothetical protein [Lachnospiraceae bacterium]